MALRSRHLSGTPVAHKIIPLRHTVLRHAKLSHKGSCRGCEALA